MKIEIYPLERVVLDGISIELDMEQAAVEAMLGKGEHIGNRYYYYGGELAIDYTNGKVAFIEFLAGIEGKLRPTVYGISVFETKANDLFAILKKQNDGPIGDTEGGHSYQFRNISVGIYREVIPEEIREMIRDAESFGNPMSDSEIQYEMHRAEHWATFGIGVIGYYG